MKIKRKRCGVIRSIPIIALVVLIGFLMAACDDGTNPVSGDNQTPVADDFVIGNLTQTVGSVILVTITPKAGKSTGAITIYYNSSTTLPTEVGTYPVTFDVAAAAGWNAASGLAAGTLTINETNQIPVADDFVIGNLTQTVGSVIPVTITPKTGKSTGAITIYYNGSTTLPTTAGTYPVTFDVAAALGFDAASGLAAGTLTINAVPIADDFVIGNLTQTVGSVIPVTITPKTDKSNGTITIYYNGSTTLPTAVGTYPVTFDVVAVTGWNAATGLAAGTLVINAVPVADDFDISGTGTYPYDGSPKVVTITPKQNKSTGAISIYYNGSATPPTAAGIYTVTFNVAAVAGWNVATGLAAGTLTITEIADTIGIQFTGSGDEVINLTLSDGNDIPAGQEFTVTVDGNYDHYRWYLDGSQYPGGNENTFTVGNWLSIGIHTVMAVVTKNNVPYSKELIFRIVR